MDSTFVTALLLESVALLAVNVPTFKVMSPAGACPLVLAVTWLPLVKLTVFAVI